MEYREGCFNSPGAVEDQGKGENAADTDLRTKPENHPRKPQPPLLEPRPQPG